MKKFLTMALALMMVLSLFAVPTMAEVVLGEDLLNGKGTFEDYAVGTTFPAAGTDQFAVHADNQMTATVEADGENQYVTITPAAETRNAQLYFTKGTQLGETTTYLTPVEAGKTYVLNFDAYIPADAALELSATYNQTLYYWINWFDANGAAAANTKVYSGLNRAALNMGEWAHYEAFFKVPDGVSYINGYITMGKKNVELSLDNITLTTTNRVNPVAHTYGAAFPGTFEEASVNVNWSGGYSIGTLTLGSKQQAGTSATEKFYAYNSESGIGVLPKEGNWFIGIGTATTYDADHTAGNMSGQVWMGNTSTPILEYGETYEISVWFNAENAKDSYTGEEGDKPLVPVIATNCYGTSQLSRGTEKMTFPEAYKTKGWQKLTWEYTVPEKSWYDALTASGKKAGVMDIGIACYSSDATIGYFDDLTIVKKTAAPAPTEFDVTITGENAITSVSAATSTGDAVNFTAKPKFGYYIESITIGGTPFNGFDAYKGGTYTTGTIAADTEIVVTVAALSANTEEGVSTDVATLPAVFAETGEAPVTFGKVLADIATVDEFGIYLTKGGEGVTSAKTEMGPHFKAFYNVNGQYAIEFQGLEAGEYVAQTYVKVAGVTTYGIETTFTVE